MKKVKPVNPTEIEPLVEKATWVRRQGLSGALPPGVHLPAEKLYLVTVSGSLGQPRVESKHGETGAVVAAWDVFRLDPDDAPFTFNVDHYFVLRSDDQCLLFGPFKSVDPAHWLEEIPPGFEDCEVLTTPTKG